MKLAIYHDLSQYLQFSASLTAISSLFLESRRANRDYCCTVINVNFLLFPPPLSLIDSTRSILVSYATCPLHPWLRSGGDADIRS